MEHPEAIRNLKRRMSWEQARQAPPEGFPPFPPIPPGRYTSDEFYKLEKAHLWNRVWLYAGHESQLAQPGDYLLLDVPDAPMFLIRGRDRKIRAFYNVCSHRGAPLVRERTGSQHRLRCIYHQWTYDTQGQLIAVMDERDFPQPFDKRCLGLQEVRCEQWGPWIFVNEDANAPPLLAWLDMLTDEFEQFEIGSLRPAAIRSYEVECNWKLTMDAFLEVYHIKGIHPETVGPSLDHRGAVMGLLPNGHTRMTCPTNAPPGEVAARRGYNDGSDNAIPRIALGEIAANYHVSHNVFPNVITPTSDVARQFLMFWPLAKTRTRIDVVHFGLDWGDAEAPEGWKQLLAFWEIVMAEDLQFLEWQQKAVLSPGFKGYRLSYLERRIYYAHESIDRTIGIDNIPAELRVKPMLDAHRERAGDRCADPLTRQVVADADA